MCKHTDPTTPAVVSDCSSMPAPAIEPPLPGEAVVTVTSQIPGAEILVFASGTEIGHSSGAAINLSRALEAAETVVTEQRLGKCLGPLAYQITVRQPAP